MASRKLRFALIAVGAIVVIGALAVGAALITKSNNSSSSQYVSDSSASPSPETATTQTSTAVYSNAEARAKYASVLAVMQGFFDSESTQSDSANKFLRESSDAPGEQVYDLHDCQPGSAYISGLYVKDDIKLAEYADLAYLTVVWRGHLKQLGYPEELWASDVDQFENSELDEIERSGGERETNFSAWMDARNNAQQAFMQALATKLNDYRASNPSLVRIIVAGECGGDSVDVGIITNPPGAQVLIIPTFFHELCRVENINPDDPAACDRWREPKAGRLEQVAGNYFYIAHWPDGTTGRGSINLDKINEDETVTLQKP